MSIVARVEREKDSFFTLFLQQKVLHRSQKTKEELIESRCSVSASRIAGREKISGSNLVLVGFNQGGLTSGLAAAKCGNEISKLIMVFPVLGIPEHTRDRF